MDNIKIIQFIRTSISSMSVMDSTEEVSRSTAWKTLMRSALAAMSFVVIK